MTRRSRADVPRRVVVAVVSIAVILAVTSSAVRAEPQPSEKTLRQELVKLEKQADILIEEYGRKRNALQRAQKAERAANERLRQAESDHEQLRDAVRLLATQRYQAGGITAFTASVGGADPDVFLSQSTLTQQLLDEQAARLQRFLEVRNALKYAEDTARNRTEELRSALQETDTDKRRVQSIIRKLKERLDQLIPISGKGPGGTWLRQLPSGPDNITERMRVVRDQIKQQFAVPFGIGCYRQGGDGEHPLGRACDFMLSSGGTMPSPEEAQRGYDIADWAVKNASRLGIMYIIYRQRIWNSRLAAAGWRSMSDRGGITANHFDHPHISVY